MSPYCEKFEGDQPTKEDSFLPATVGVVVEDKSCGLVQEAIPSTSPPSHLYDLFSVIIHEGGAYGGHYHAYICDYEKDDDEAKESHVAVTGGGDIAALERARASGATNLRGWYDFNDAKVERIDAASIANQYGREEARECACGCYSGCECVF